jgi:hypothetical protein
MGRAITKDRYHNNRDELNKQRKRDIESIREDIMKNSDVIEIE